MLKADGREVYLGGNIGNSLIEQVLHIPSTAEIVLELSSFQLMTLTDSPQAAVITNLSPNHLDYHTSFDEYVQVKTNLLRAQNKDAVAVLNWDNQLTKELGDQMCIRDRPKGVSARWSVMSFCSVGSQRVIVIELSEGTVWV